MCDEYQVNRVHHSPYEVRDKQAIIIVNSES